MQYSIGAIYDTIAINC